MQRHLCISSLVNREPPPKRGCTKRVDQLEVANLGTAAVSERKHLGKKKPPQALLTQTQTNLSP